MFVAQAIILINATQINGGKMMTRAPRRRRRGWRLDELTVLVSFVRSAIRELTSCLLSSTAAPRVCSGRVSCPTYTPLYCTVPTLCEHAHHSEPPLCHCDAESKATPACDNTTQQHKRPAGRIRHWTGSAASQICAFLEAHRRHFDSQIRRNLRWSYYHWTSALPADGIRRNIARRRMSARQHLTSTVER